MAWEIKFSSLAQKNLQQLDHQVVQRILKFFLVTKFDLVMRVWQARLADESGRSRAS